MWKPMKNCLVIEDNKCTCPQIATSICQGGHTNLEVKIYIIGFFVIHLFQDPPLSFFLIKESEKLVCNDHPLKK